MPKYLKFAILIACSYLPSVLGDIRPTHIDFLIENLANPKPHTRLHSFLELVAPFTKFAWLKKSEVSAIKNSLKSLILDAQYESRTILSIWLAIKKFPAIESKAAEKFRAELIESFVSNLTTIFNQTQENFVASENTINFFLSTQLRKKNFALIFQNIDRNLALENLASCTEIFKFLITVFFREILETQTNLDSIKKFDCLLHNFSEILLETATEGKNPIFLQQFVPAIISKLQQIIQYGLHNLQDINFIAKLYTPKPIKKNIFMRLFSCFCWKQITFKNEDTARQPLMRQNYSEILETTGRLKFLSNFLSIINLAEKLYAKNSELLFCAICLSPIILEGTTGPCKNHRHLFHSHCIKRWLYQSASNSQRCPCCSFSRPDASQLLSSDLETVTDPNNLLS